MFLKRLGKDEMRKMIVRYVLPGVEAELNARRVYASSSTVRMFSFRQRRRHHLLFVACFIATDSETEMTFVDCMSL